MPNKGSKKLLDRGESFSYKGKWRCFFDGGCKHKVASGGYIIFGPDGVMVKGRAMYFGKGTNNMAEVLAVEAMIRHSC